MPLKIKPPPRRETLSFCATPFLDDDPNQLWDEGIRLFHNWMLDHFEPGKLYGDFEVAEKLNVHRVIADEWLMGMLRSGRLFDRLHFIGLRYTEDAPEAHGFILTGIPVGEARSRVHVDTVSVVLYDPWTMRDFDASVPNAKHADAYIDKYYMIDTNEHFIFRKKPLILNSGHLFVPVSLKGRPRYEDTAEAKIVRAGEAPPASWRDRVEFAARGETTFRRKRTG